jgi:hypothetical protein
VGLLNAVRDSKKEDPPPLFKQKADLDCDYGLEIGRCAGFEKYAD